jgi:hypothetical protein
MYNTPLDTFLNQVHYRDRSRVKNDVKAVMDQHKSLLPHLSNYGNEIQFFFVFFLNLLSSVVSVAQANGPVVRVIALSGTIPITYAGNQVNCCGFLQRFLLFLVL